MRSPLLLRSLAAPLQVRVLWIWTRERKALYRTALPQNNHRLHPPHTLREATPKISSPWTRMEMMIRTTRRLSPKLICDRTQNRKNNFTAPDQHPSYSNFAFHLLTLSLHVDLACFDSEFHGCTLKSIGFLGSIRADHLTNSIHHAIAGVIYMVVHPVQRYWSYLRPMAIVQLARKHVLGQSSRSIYCQRPPKTWRYAVPVSRGKTVTARDNVPNESRCVPNSARAAESRRVSPSFRSYVSLKPS